MTTAKTHAVRVPSDVHDDVRIAAAALTAQMGRPVTQAEVLASALAVAQVHPDEVRAALVEVKS